MNLIAEIAARHPPGALAVIAGERQFTYAELFAVANAVAARLERAGLCTPGRCPRIGLRAPDGPGYIMLAMGILLAGGCLVPIPTELAPPEQLDIARTTALDALILATDHTWPESLGAPLAGADEPVSWMAWRLVGVTPGFPEDEFQALNPAFIRFSSGTTGTSKGIVISHPALLERILAANQGLGIGAGDRVLWLLPMAHHFAVSIVLYLYHGCVTVLEDAALAEEMLASAERHGATVIYGAPFHYAQLAGTPAGAGAWPTLRLAVSTAAALSAVTAENFMRRFGKPLHQGLGVIEVGLPILNLSAAAGKPESIGRPQPGFEVRLVDDAGEPVARGEVGELLLRGPGMLDAYLLPWQPAATVLGDGWFATGDLVAEDSDGDLFIRGRKKSLINVAGMKVFPEEVEAVLATHPAVARCRVSAIDHPHFGQIPTAEVIPAHSPPPSPRALIDFCRLHLAPHKIPARIAFVDALPLTPSGKLRRG